MTEKELINQIKELKQIKPQKDWAVLLKAQILEKEKPERKLIFFRDILRVFQLKPAFATATALMLFAVAIAGFLFFTNEKPAKIAETQTETQTEPKPAEGIILALGELQTQIEQATESLKEIKEPQKVLEARNIVIPFIEATKETIAQIEKLESTQNLKTDNEILATRNSIDKLQSAERLTLARVANDLIQFLKTRTLTESEQEILKNAKQAYSDGNYKQALINAMLVRQLIERRDRDK